MTEDRYVTYREFCELKTEIITKHDHEVLIAQMHELITPLRQYMLTQQGRTASTSQILTFIGGILTLIFAAATIVIVFVH